MKVKIVVSLIVVTCLVGFSIRSYTIESVREVMLVNFLTSYRNYASDTSIAITTGKELPGVFKTFTNEKYYPTDRCGSSPAYLYYGLYISLDSNAYWNYSACTYDESFRARYKSLFGQDIIKARIKMAQKDYENNNMEWRHYSAVGLQAAFEKLYQAPSGTFHGYSLQKIYDASVKKYVHDITMTVVKVMAKRLEFEQYAKQYLQQATTRADFEGQEFGNNVTEKLLGKSAGDCIDAENQTRIVGIMLRRQCDGSLPVLLSSLKTVLKDYDPTLYKAIQTKF